MKLETCTKCGEEKNWHTEFPRNRAAKGGRLSFCRNCKAVQDLEYRTIPENQERARQRAREQYQKHKVKRQEYIRAYQRDKKQQAVEFAGGKCERCGFAHLAALQFHHREPEKKMFDISSKTLSSPRQFPWEEVVAEIGKCELLCANCHAVEHCTWE